jgi:hypothetical protein
MTCRRLTHSDRDNAVGTLQHIHGAQLLELLHLYFSVTPLVETFLGCRILCE